MSIDFKALAGALLAQSETLVPRWFPNGKREGHEWKVGNLGGEAGDSLSVNLLKGVWKDFAADESGADLISLFAAMHNLTQGAAAAELMNGAGLNLSLPHYEPGGRAPDEPLEDDIFERPPATASFTGRHKRLGGPSATYLYADLEGRLHYVCRYETTEGKAIIPWRWMGQDWVPKHVPKRSREWAGRPLYKLDLLQQYPEKSVLVVEGEKCVDAALKVIRTALVTTWSGGANAVKYADWSPLAGRKVIIWPDCDEAGRTAAAKVGELLLPIARKVEIVNVTDQPPGWDIADAIEQGWTGAQCVSWARERYAKVGGSVVDIPAASEGPAAAADDEPPTEEPAPPTHTAQLERAPADVPPAVGASYTGLWREYGLELNGRGRPYANADNVLRALTHEYTVDANTRRSSVWYDEFRQQILARDGDAVTEWTDNDDAKVMLWLQRNMGMPDMRSSIVGEAVAMWAYTRRRNEAREWLQSLSWDGKPRLATLLPTGFGTDDDPYHRAVGRCFLMGMAARILRPGCKVDTMPVFEGRQGTYKSTALEVVGGPWHGVIHEKFGEKDFYLALRGKMLVEISELAAFSQRQIETINGVVTTATDTYRAPYERRAADHPRMCVFAGTTNRDDWNKDDTGARRFWPVECGRIRLEWLREHRIQLFAEARARVDRGEVWYDVPIDLASAKQLARHEGDVFDEAISRWVHGKEEVSIPEILVYALNIEDKARWDMVLTKRIGGTLRRLGYVGIQARRQGSKLRVWKLRLAPTVSFGPPPAPDPTESAAPAGGQLPGF